MRDDNIALGKLFAKKYNKKYGIITYSGTLAIEIALKSMLKANSKIIVASNVCYSIINTIIKLNMIPVIVTPNNNFFLTDYDIETVINLTNIDCILLVHQFGLLNNIDTKKYQKSGIKIIEDVAQSWNLNSKIYKIGTNSDIVVTSFGKTKPLSYGIGGGLFFDNIKILKNVDYCDDISRENENILLSYLYPLCENIDFKSLSLLADNIIKEQRNIANQYSKILKKQSTIKYYDPKEYHQNVWHRFPIWIEDEQKYQEILNYFKKNNLEYQLPHKIELKDLKRNKKSIKIDNSKNKKRIILLRTRNININNQLEVLKKIYENISI